METEAINWYIVVGLFLGFFVLEFLGTRQVNSIIEKKFYYLEHTLSLYGLFTWLEYTNLSLAFGMLFLQFLVQPRGQ